MAYIPDGGKASSTNNTTSTLTSSTTYVGTGELNPLPDVMVNCTADVAGTLYFDFSVDNSNWTTEAAIPLAANEVVTKTATKGSRYFRARYINGGSNQSTFRLYSYYGEFNDAQSLPPENGWIRFDSGSISASQDFNLLDLSDTTNYPHTNTNYIVLDMLRVNIDADATADYRVSIGFLEDVNASNGDYYEVIGFDGDLVAGTGTDNGFISFQPFGLKCKSGSLATSNTSLNNTGFKSGTNLASTLDPTTVDTANGSGDLILRLTMNAGTLALGIEASYRTY